MNMINWLFWLKKDPVFHSQVNGKITIGNSYRKTTLFVNNIPQSGGEYIFMWKKVLKSLDRSLFQPKHCLVLGVGGGTVIKELINNCPLINIKGVEIDPVMLKIGRKHFGLETHKNIELVAQDAVDFIAKEHGNKYDLIIVDLYLGLFNPPS
ncbi:methyltransferase domain-containing protein, partial [Candidatus Gottesmanbacteria bacterium]|nr:methyltransferase domain-containing protein [Candidatus Gottesmanbacteria bacterium]